MIENGVIANMAQQRPEGIGQFYKECGLNAKGIQLFKCELCRERPEPFTIDRVRMICHIYIKHGKSEIMDPKYKSVATNFNLEYNNQSKSDVGRCRVPNCNVKIISKFGKALPFKNHLITHHADDKKSFFTKAVEIDSGRKILNNYKIEDTKNAKCSFCRTLIPLEGLDSRTAEVLTALSRHLIPHIDEYLDILEQDVQDLQYLDEAFIQSELEEEENMQLEVNEIKQNIDIEVKMKKTERKMVAVSEDFNTLLQRYNMKYVPTGKCKLRCNIDSQHRYMYDANKLYCIRNHWEIHHGPKNMIYDEIKNDEYITIIFRNYKITDGTLATCSQCEYSENMEKDNELYLDGLIIIRNHWNQNHSKRPMAPSMIKADERLRTKVQELKMKRREAAMQISHPAERSEQNIPSEGVPETQETPEAESSEIRSTATQSSATVENMPRQSSDDEDILVSGETQSPLTVEPPSKQIRLDPDTDVVE